MEEYLSQLNQQQIAAVEYCDGPQLVIAGAGSGKTRVLTYKIVHLLNHGYEPWRILALTFTNKAAREMRERIEQLVGPKTASRLWMGTFHSIFARILRQNAERIGYKSSFTIYDAADSKALVKSIIKDLDLDDKVYKPSAVLSSISTAKNALISPEKYVSMRDIMEADKQSRRPQTYLIYRIYRDRCFTSGAMDFDDLLYYTNLLLRDNPDLLHHYQEYFRYVLVDEYQDTNFAQHVIVSQICNASQKLCVVGDDAQSIYSFRGANIANILNLKNAYPDLGIFKLEQNYRSTQNIIEAANSLIEKNTQQIKKHVFSEGPVGDRIEVVQSYSDFEEGYLVANRISQLKMRTSDSYEDFAILYRTNAQSRVLEESLRKRNIPYRIYGGLSFYQRKEVKDAIAYFRLSVNPNDDEALRRVINYPARGIGETTLKKLTRAAMDHNVSTWEVICNLDNYPETGFNSGTKRKLDEFRTLIEGFIQANESGQNACDVAQLIISRSRLLAVLLSDNTPENLSKQENINELLAGVKEFVDNRIEEGNPDLSMVDFLGEVSLATDQDQDDTDSQAAERVTLMTVHAAKGLEFNNIFIVGVEEDLFPSAMASGSLSEIEEERRLLYVAITRAKNHCMITYASSRYRNGQTCTTSPSRFLRDIDRKYLNLSSGASLGSNTSSLSSFRNSYHSSMSSSTPRNQVSATTAHSISATPNFTAPTPKSVSSAAKANHDVSELAEGMKIEHSRFGLGIISKIDTSHTDPRIVVEFSDVGQRVLLLKFAKFSIL
ncbi:MAG: UvrD-helicase domain-containing protein [Bacteroides sp.]|nr:UvrD-helicase domain-containing protein [Bacteroides sp.]MCM1412735.1 UvrD-helicase domain-containing protein [Bacteroides sp.]MCM1470971.1 UvrD-helicase domain-containing protein [Bacteroides sp.]